MITVSWRFRREPAVEFILDCKREEMLATRVVMANIIPVNIRFCINLKLSEFGDVARNRVDIGNLASLEELDELSRMKVKYGRCRLGFAGAGMPNI